MKTENMLRANYLDLLFQNRNKQYGSYVLRRDANRIRLLSLFTVFGLFIVGIFISYWIKSNTPAATNHMDTQIIHDPVVMTTIVLPERQPEPVLPEPAGSAPAAATEKFTPPIITNEPVIAEEDILKDINTFEDKLAGNLHYEGDAGGLLIAKQDALPNIGGNGILNGTNNGSGTEADDSKKVYQTVSVMPEFPGGSAALRAYLKKGLNYPEAAIYAQISGTVLVEFVVNEHGAIEQAVVIKGIGGGCDQEALRVINAMPRWSAGKVGDKTVKTRYKLPITFHIRS